MQTRQLNIWGFVRCETLGGERDGWQHKDKDFIRGLPDLLNKIKRIPVKSKSNVKKIASVTTKSKSKTSSSSRSARGNVLKATVEKKIASVSDESSCSSSSLDSQASSYSGGNSAHVPARQGATFPAAQDHGPVFQYFAAPISHLNYVQPSSLQVQGGFSSMPPSSVQSFNNETSMQQIEATYKHDVDNNVQPFNDDELVYLASIFEDDGEKHSSGNDDLASILSLNQEGSVEDFIFGL